MSTRALTKGGLLVALALCAAGPVRAGNRVTTEARDLYMGDAGCPHLVANVENADRFFATLVTPSWSIFHLGTIWRNDEVSHIHFVDNVVDSGGSDHVNFDRQNNQDAFGFFSGHGGCEGRTDQVCTTHEQCTSPPNPSWGGQGLCIRHTMDEGRCLYPAGREIAASQDCRSANTASDVFFGESGTSGGWAGAGTDGGVNFVVLDMSCGVQPDMWFSNYQRVGAGVHTIASIMPTHKDSDTTSTRFRGLYFANTYASGFDRAVVHDWVTSTFNNVSSGRSCVFGGGWHGIAGCGAYITLSIDSSEERAVWSRDTERWTFLPNDNNDAAGNLWFAWRYTCNYDCNNIPWQMSPGGILQPAEGAALPAPLVTPGEDRTPRPGRAFQLAQTRSGVRLGASVKRSLGPDGAMSRHGREGGYVRRPNGWAYALADTDSPALKARPYTAKPEVHHARALEYFGQLGLPKDEVGGIHVSTTMSGKGLAADWSPAGRRKDTFEGYTSHLERFIAGTRVVGSFAWVRFNEHAQVVEEGVYWPAVEERVVAEAVRFAEALADEGRRQEFLRRVAGSVQGEVDDSGEVVIVHSAAADSGPFEAFAAYRVTPRGERKQVTRYFDAGGVERPVLE